MAYSEEFWYTIQIFYESGRFASIPELHEYCKKIFPNIKVPSQSAIEKRAAADDWNKYRLEPKLEEEIENRSIDLFATHGMPREKAAQLIIRGMQLPDDGTNTAIGEIRRALTESGTPIDANVIEAIKRNVGDYDTSIKFIRAYMDITGWEGTKKSVIDHQSKGRQLKNLDPTTVEDVEARVLSRIKKLAGAGVLKLSELVKQ